MKLKLKRCIQNISTTRLGGVQRTNSIGLRSSILRILMSSGVIATSKIDILSRLEIRKIVRSFIRNNTEPQRSRSYRQVPAYSCTVHLQEQAGFLPHEVVEGTWVPGSENATTLRGIQAQVKHRQRWEARVADLKAQIWAGEDSIEEATDAAACMLAMYGAARAC